MNAPETQVAAPEVAERPSLAAAYALIAALTARVAALETVRVAKESEVEMTDEMAEAVTYGEHAALKHKDAAAALGLTYGQVYSARLEFTFKAVHKAAKEAGKKNAWVK